MGLAAGVLTQGFVTDALHVHGSELEWLVRFALILPGLIFVAWWLLFPGISIDEPEEMSTTAPIDPAERLERIEATFDAAAVPRARRSAFEAVDEQERTAYRNSIRRDPQLAAVEPSSFGIRRPAPAKARDTGA